jgi:hypothetical protein
VKEWESKKWSGRRKKRRWWIRLKGKRLIGMRYLRLSRRTVISEFRLKITKIRVRLGLLLLDSFWGC